MVASIVGAIFSSICNFVFGMFQQKQAKENEFKAIALEQQKKSIVEGQALEVKIQAAQKNIPEVKTKADLTRILGLAGCVLFMITVTGCMAVKVESTVSEYRTVIKTKKPDPTMAEGPDELTPREQKMGKYIGQLRAAVSVHNTDALEKNKKFNYPIAEAVGDEEIIRAEVVPLPEVKPEK